MNAQFLSFAAGFIGFVLYVMIFLLLVRIRGKVEWFKLQVVSASIVHVVSSVFLIVFFDGFLYWYAFGLFSVCWFSFFTLSTAIYVSVSARVLRIIDTQPEHAISVNVIYDICVRPQFEERIEFLVASGLAEKRDNGFRITNQGYRSARRLMSMRQFWGMDGSGLYSSYNKGNQ